MPYILRKSRGRELYWVVNRETGKKYSKEPMPLERAKAQMGALYMRTGSESLEGGSLDEEQNIIELIILLSKHTSPVV